MPLISSNPHWDDNNQDWLHVQQFSNALAFVWLTDSTVMLFLHTLLQLSIIANFIHLNLISRTSQKLENRALLRDASKLASFERVFCGASNHHLLRWHVVKDVQKVSRDLERNQGFSCTLCFFWLLIHNWVHLRSIRFTKSSIWIEEFFADSLPKNSW